MANSVRRNAALRKARKVFGFKRGSHTHGGPFKAPFWEVNGHKVNAPRNGNERLGLVLHPATHMSRGRWYLRGK